MAHQSLDELEWYLRRLRYARREGKLVFVVGAGINKEYGLPDWAQMLTQLTVGCGKLRAAPPPPERTDGTPPRSTRNSASSSTVGSKQFIDDVIADPLLQAAAIRGAYANPGDWIRALQSTLAYSPNVLDDTDKPLGKLATIAANQYRDDPRRHIAILTFNFDDLIEGALRKELGNREAERIVASVSNATELGRARQRPGIYVYHLHGSLANQASDIVLDAYSYVRILAAPGNHWSWGCMNTFLFQKDSGSMFIGLSLLDPSLRLLLTQSATNGMALSAIFVGKPLDPPLLDSNSLALRNAWMMHDVQKLFDNLLEELSLIPYHVTEWSEVGSLLDRVSDDD